MKKITLLNRVTNSYFNFAFCRNICGFLSFKFIRKIIVITNICQSPINLKAYDLRDGNEGIYIKNSFQAETREEILKLILIKKYLLPIFLFLFSIVAVAQLKQRLPHKLDAIFANEKKTVALFFLNSIRQAITAAKHFVFNYNREKQQYFGLLQAKPGAESNLLTIIENGQVYSYILKYKKQLKRINYFISEKESVGNDKPIKIAIKQQKSIINEQVTRISNYQRFCEYLLSSKLKNIATKRKKGVIVQLQKAAYNASELYLVIGKKIIPRLILR